MALSKPIYQQETHRLATFHNYDGPKSILHLAKCGFFWSHDHEKITCYKCGFSLNNWNSTEDVIERHKQYSPRCQAAVNNDRDNILMKSLPEDFESLLESAVLTPIGWKIDAGQRVEKKKGPSDTTDCMSESQFKVTCIDIYNRAKREGIIGGNSQHTDAVLPVIVLKNPDLNLLKDERIRLSTFIDWPDNANARPNELAKNGLFYTGATDRVQCAFCRGFLRNWAPSDVVADEHRTHFPGCHFVQGRDVGNMSIEENCHRDGGFVMTSLRRSPSPRRRQDTADDDEVSFRSTAARRTPSPPRPREGGIDREDAMNIEITDAERTQASLPLRYRVKHPEFTTRQSRMQTFLNARGLLPRGQNIDTLVDAGFYHVGPHDNVKCFCCDIGLKNWQIDDNPWIEHARWFPRCSYLKEKKDDAFIQAAQADRNRWLHNNAVDDGMPLPSLNVEPSNMSLLENTSMPAGPDVIGDDIHGARPGIDELMGAPGARMRNQRAEVVAGMVYLEEPGERGGANEVRRQQRDVDNNDDDDLNVVEIDPEAQQLLEENRQLREVRTCKVCMDKDVNIVFLPCGHLVCCDNCAPVLRTCAVCRSLIRGTVKIFLA